MQGAGESRYEYVIKAGDLVLFEGNDLDEARDAYLRAGRDERYYACKIYLLRRGEVACTSSERIGHRPSDKKRR